MYDSRFWDFVSREPPPFALRGALAALAQQNTNRKGSGNFGFGIQGASLQMLCEELQPRLGQTPKGGSGFGISDSGFGIRDWI